MGRGDGCTLYRMPRRRSFAAAGLGALGLGSGVATCSAFGDLGPGVRPLSLAGLGIETSLALLAFAGALLSVRPVAVRLGLVGGRLSFCQLLVLAAGTVALSHTLDSLLILTGLREHSALGAFEATMAGARGADLALALLAMAVAPALGEEFLCRGFVQCGLEPRHGAGRAVVGAALVFGLLHIDPVHAAFATLLGLYLGAIAWLAGSVWASVLCHGVNNTLAVLTASGVLGAPPGTLATAAVGLALAAAALAGIALRLPPEGQRADSVQ